MGTEIFRMCSLGLSLNEILQFLHRAKRYFCSLFSFAVDASVLSVGSVVQLRRAIAGISKNRRPGAYPSDMARNFCICVLIMPVLDPCAHP